MNRFHRNNRCGDSCVWFEGSKAPAITAVSVGEEYHVKIEDVNRQANNGIDKIEVFVNFVSKASPRERVMVRTVRVRTGDEGPKS